MLTELELNSKMKSPKSERVSESEYPKFFGKKLSGANKSFNFYLTCTYPAGTKQQTLNIGTFPKKSLKTIRAQAKQIREWIADGQDPKLKRAEQKMGLSDDKSFGAMIDKWFQEKFLQEAKNRKYIERVESKLTEVKRDLGGYQTKDITAVLLQNSISKIAKTSKGEADRTVKNLVKVFQYANAIYGVGSNTAAFDLIGNWVPPKSKPRPAITDEVPFKEMIGDVLAEAAKPQSDLLFLVALLTFARISELVRGKWAEINWQDRIWLIPAIADSEGNRTKKAKGQAPKPHDIFLTDELTLILNNLHAVTGHSEYVFPAIYRRKNPWMSVATVQKRIKETKRGKYKGVQSQHGFRSNAATWIAKTHKNLPNGALAVEIASGRTPDGVEYVYNRYSYWEEQCEVWKLWSSYIASLLPCPITEIGKHPDV